MSPEDDDRTQFVTGPHTTPGAEPAPKALTNDTGGLPVGTRLGECEITSLVGEGDFGLVYSAHDRSLQRRVAAKECMPSSLAARGGGSQVQVQSERHRETFEAGLESFINEARLLASFDHPSLVESAKGRYSELFLGAVDRALAVRPEERTQSIGELRQDLGLGAATVDPYSTVPLPPGSVPGRDAAPSTAAWPTPAPAPAASRSAAPAAAASASSSPAPRAAAPTAAAPPPPPAVAPAVPTSFDVAAEFTRVGQAQTPGFDGRLQTNRANYRIDRDELSFTIQSAREGFVDVFTHGASGELAQLYPAHTDGAIKARPGQRLRLPQGGVYFPTTGPAGPTDLLAIVSPRQRDFSAMRPRSESSYRVFPTGAEAALLAAQAPGPLPPMAGRAVCPPGVACEDEYGAALVRVEVVP